MFDVFPPLVYILCAITSGICAGLLARGYQRSAARILLWSAVSFTLLTLNNILVVIDIFILPDSYLRAPRLIVSLAAGAVLLWGFIWDMEE